MLASTMEKPSRLPQGRTSDCRWICRRSSEAAILDQEGYYELITKQTQPRKEQNQPMLPKHNFFFWNYPENVDRIPANLDRALAMQIFRQGRMYEQLKQGEAKNRKSKK
jgi:hypothetical protein